jgi:hypothetical protein
MITRFRLVACLGSLFAIMASREPAAAAYRPDPAVASTAVLFTDGSIIRMAQDDSNAAATQTPDNSGGDDSSQSPAPPQNPG